MPNSHRPTRLNSSRAVWTAHYVTAASIAEGGKATVWRMSVCIPSRDLWISISPEIWLQPNGKSTKLNWVEGKKNTQIKQTHDKANTLSQYTINKNKPLLKIKLHVYGYQNTNAGFYGLKMSFQAWHIFLSTSHWVDEKIPPTLINNVNVCRLK